MPSFWPWKGDDDSPAAFEKTLSELSSRIGKASSNLEVTRQRGRRFKGLWTLYTGLGYLVYLIIAVVVIGFHSWGAAEFTAVLGAPVVMFAIRYSIVSYYDYRTSSQQKYLQGLQKQRDETITKLKEATKYNTTQQLLDKYGGTPQKPVAKSKREKGNAQAQENSQSSKKRRETTGFVPPPTANIPGRRIVSASVPGSPQVPPEEIQAQGLAAPQSAAAAVAPWRQEEGEQHALSQINAGAEFAPNAFSEPRVYDTGGEGTKWYDRLMDVILGEDEANPKNRMVLICQSCRLVNGQAPPGIKTLEELGKWTCSACGEMNGEDTEAQRIVANIQAQAGGASSDAGNHLPGVSESEEVDGGSDHTVYSEGEEPKPAAAPKLSPPKRRRPKESDA